MTVPTLMWMVSNHGPQQQKEISCIQSAEVKFIRYVKWTH